MARKVFYSFHHKNDSWRTSTVRNIGALEANPSLKDNEWETIERGGAVAIQRWIDGQMAGRTCTIVLIGQYTANREWIDYEIKKSWADREGLLGIYIHALLDQDQKSSRKGDNPFATFSVGNRKLSDLVSAYDPPYADSKQAYAYIAAGIEKWVETAIIGAATR